MREPPSCTSGLHLMTSVAVLRHTPAAAAQNKLECILVLSSPGDCIPAAVVGGLVPGVILDMEAYMAAKKKHSLCKMICTPQPYLHRPHGAQRSCGF